MGGAPEGRGGGIGEVLLSSNEPIDEILSDFKCCDFLGLLGGSFGIFPDTGGGGAPVGTGGAPDGSGGAPAGSGGALGGIEGTPEGGIEEEEVLR